jgi:hypothetical protein
MSPDFESKLVSLSKTRYSMRLTASDETPVSGKVTNRGGSGVLCRTTDLGYSLSKPEVVNLSRFAYQSPRFRGM